MSVDRARGRMEASVSADTSIVFGVQRMISSGRWLENRIVVLASLGPYGRHPSEHFVRKSNRTSRDINYLGAFA
jgi:hypothetical protein